MAEHGQHPHLVKPPALHEVAHDSGVPTLTSRGVTGQTEESDIFVSTTGTDAVAGADAGGERVHLWFKVYDRLRWDGSE